MIFRSDRFRIQHPVRHKLELEPNTTYTLSGKIKTDLAKSRAYFNIDLRDKDQKRIQWIHNEYSALAGKNDWTKRQITFTTPANAGKAVVYMDPYTQQLFLHSLES